MPEKFKPIESAETGEALLSEVGGLQRNVDLLKDVVAAAGQLKTEVLKKIFISE